MSYGSLSTYGSVFHAAVIYHRRSLLDGHSVGGSMVRLSIRRYFYTCVTQLGRPFPDSRYIRLPAVLVRVRRVH